MLFLLILLPLLVLVFLFNVIRVIYYVILLQKLKKEFRDTFGHDDYYGHYS